MNFLFLLTFIEEYKLENISYIYDNFENLIKYRNIFVSQADNQSVYLESLNFQPDSFLIRDFYLQTRLIDYLYNSDYNNLDYFNDSNKNISSNTYYLFSKNRYLALTLEISNFNEDETDSSEVKEFFNNIYSNKEEILNEKKTNSSTKYILDRGCKFENFSGKNYISEDDSLQTLFFPSNITKCDALNIAYLENQLINEKNKIILANLYFKNPVSNIIFNYQIKFSRVFTHGIKLIY